jgi:hypothetical protein
MQQLRFCHYFLKMRRVTLAAGLIWTEGQCVLSQHWATSSMVMSVVVTGHMVLLLLALLRMLALLHMVTLTSHPLRYLCMQYNITTSNSTYWCCCSTGSEAYVTRC